MQKEKGCDLVDRINGLIHKITRPMEKKIDRLEDQLRHCRDTMTNAQRCRVFQEQNCHDCDNLECCDNMRTPVTITLADEVRRIENINEKIARILDGASIDTRSGGEDLTLADRVHLLWERSVNGGGECKR